MGCDGWAVGVGEGGAGLGVCGRRDEMLDVRRKRLVPPLTDTQRLLPLSTSCLARRGCSCPLTPLQLSVACVHPPPTPPPPGAPLPPAHYPTRPPTHPLPRARVQVDLFTEADRTGRGGEFASSYASSQLAIAAREQVEELSAQVATMPAEVLKQLNTKKETVTPWWVCVWGGGLRQGRAGGVREGRGGWHSGHRSALPSFAEVATPRSQLGLRST